MYKVYKFGYEGVGLRIDNWWVLGNRGDRDGYGGDKGG